MCARGRCLLNRFEDESLVLRELPRGGDRVGAGDVAAVAAELTAHVREHELTVSNHAIIGSARVAVV